MLHARTKSSSATMVIVTVRVPYATGTLIARTALTRKTVTALKNVVHPRPVAATASALSNRSFATDSKSAWMDPMRRTASRARATASCKKT